MEIDGKDKKRFFELAIAKGYLSEDIVKQWGFLPVKEFLDNGYIDKQHYRELLQLTGQIFPNDDFIDTGEIPPPLSAQPMRKKFSGLSMPCDPVKSEQKEDLVALEKREQSERNTELVFEANDQTKPLAYTEKPISQGNDKIPSKLEKISLKTLKEHSEQKIKAVIKAPSPKHKRQSEQEEIVELEDCAPSASETDYDPEQEARQRLDTHQKLNKKLHQRTVRELSHSLFCTMVCSGLSLLVINIFLLSGITHAFLCLAFGAGAGYLVHRFKGNGSTLLFFVAYILCLVSGETLGAGIITTIFASYGGALIFAMIAGGCMAYICLGRAIGETIVSKRLNYS